MSGHAQLTALDPMFQTIAELGQQVSPQIFEMAKEAVRPHLRRDRAETIEVVRDIAYGEHERRRLNLFRPSDAAGRTGDAIIFVHGGAFVSGDKDESPGAFYDNVGYWAAANGRIGVVMNYRLAPGATWPAGAEDVAAAFQWARASISAYGGDAERIYLMGHSAGAAHVAGSAGLLKDDATPAGFILLSGMYDLSIPPAPTVYFGEDADAYAERAPLKAIAPVKTPIFASNAQYDPEPIQKHGLSLLQARLAAHGALPRYAQALGHNHFSTILHLNTPDTRLGDDILTFIDQTSPSVSEA